jgi:uncharacterized secreted protein with C-terminal beta-propeller domain
VKGGNRAMKKTREDLETLDKIREVLSSLDDSVSPPLSLSPDFIINKLNPQYIQETQKKKKSRRLKKTMKYFASLSLCALSLMLVFNSLTKPVKVNVSKENENVYEVADYAQLKKLVSSVFKERERENNGWGNLFSKEGFDYAVESPVEMPSAVEEVEESASDNGTVAFAGEVSSRDTSSAKGDVSETNVQVEGVDEADVIKTDGSYIYTLQNSLLRIFDVRDPKNIQILSIIHVGEEGTYFNDMYLSKDRLILVGSKNVFVPLIDKSEDEKAKEKEDYNQNVSLTDILVYDLADKTNPTLIRESQQEGSLNSSRLMGDYLYTITTKSIYKKDVDAAAANSVAPYYSDTASTLTSDGLIRLPIDKIIVPIEYNETYTILSSVNIYNTEEEMLIKSALGGGGSVYASLKNVYVVGSEYLYKNNTSTSTIQKFSVSSGEISYSGSGSVNGTTLNQFSFDEYNGYFRVATTSELNTTTQNTTQNNLYVLDASMKEVGKLEGLAKGERIYSVRFMNDMAYMVTFKQVDPLFAIDLSNPKEPKVLGELKIPGFSQYLHPISEGILLGFGQSANELGRTDGLKLSLFDVTNPLDPVEIDTRNISDQNSYSEASYNHKSLIFSESKHIVMFPLVRYENGKPYQRGFNVIYSYEGNKLKFIGSIENGVDDELDGLNRGVIIGDTVFVINGTRVKAVNYPTLKQVSELRFINKEDKVYDVK